MKRVGFFGRTRFWQIYAFNNPPGGYDYARAIDIPFKKKFGFSHPFLTQTKFVVPYQNFDFYHSYNGLVTGSKPWVVEVETMVPRYIGLKEDSKYYDWGVKKLQSDSCSGIIFTSEYTKKLNENNFKKWGINPHKCKVIYRAVETHDPLDRKGKEKKFTICFIGNFFWLKGGFELLNAFKKFNEKYSDSRLVIISNFEKSWKDIPTEEEENFVKKELSKNRNIEVRSNIPHQKVIEFMRKADVYVNTTYHDTFNNSILEGLSCGLPAITTNIRAIPEFVKDGYNGFLMTPDLNNRERMSNFILEKLSAYYNDSELLKKHSLNGKKIINEKFLLRHRNKILSEFYNHINL